MERLLDGKNITIGTCYYPEHWGRKMWEEDLLCMKDAGIEVVRVAEFAWSKIEPREGEYTYEFFDDFLDLAEKNGMRVIFSTPTATRMADGGIPGGFKRDARRRPDTARLEKTLQL